MSPINLQILKNTLLIRITINTCDRSMSTTIKGQAVEENSKIDYMIVGQRIGFFGLSLNEVSN